MLHCSAVLFVNDQALAIISLQKMAQFILYLFKNLNMKAIPARTEKTKWQYEAPFLSCWPLSPSLLPPSTLSTYGYLIRSVVTSDTTCLISCHYRKLYSSFFFNNSDSSDSKQIYYSITFQSRTKSDYRDNLKKIFILTLLYMGF